MLNGAPQCHFVFVGHRNEAVRLDREMRHHGKCVGVVDDDVGLGRVDVAPVETTFLEDIGLREGFIAA